MAGGKVMGPGGTMKSSKSTPYTSVGPRGTAGSNTSYTTGNGYESGRTSGMRKDYKANGSAKNSKA